MFLSGDNFNKIECISIYKKDYYNKYIKHNNLNNILFIDEEIDYKILNVNVKNIFFIKIDYIGYFSKLIMPLLKEKFIIITHNGDISSGLEKNILDNPLLIKWYGQNMATLNFKTEGIPIGLENKYFNRTDFNCIKMLKQYNMEKKKLLYLNFNINTNKERKKIMEIFLNKGFKKSDIKTWNEYMLELSQHKFAVSPEGNGIDCHRTWECLYIGVIPIVKKSITMNYFNELPILFVSNYENITESYLNKVYESQFKNKEFNLEKLNIDYWKNKIKNNLLANNEIIKNKKNIIILVIANYSGIYKSFIDYYWKHLINFTNKNYKDIKIYLCFGEDPKEINIPKENIIITNTKEDTIPGILKKTIISMQHIDNNYNYDYFFRTNLSSFLIIENLIKIKNNLPSNNVFAGFLGKDFVSGSGFWLSKDVVNYILENKSSINYSINDDVAIGRFLLTLIPMDKRIKLERYDIDHVNPNRNIKNIENILLEIKNNNHYHIRLKKSNRNEDIEIVKYLYNHFYN